MKKTLPLLVLFFSTAILMAQSNCGNAISVMINSTTTVSAYSTDNGVAPTELCGLTAGAAPKGKWYKYTATSNINMSVSTVLSQNNNRDTRLIVYSGSCDALVCIGSNDDYNGSLSSQVNFPVTAGTTYTFAFDNRYGQNFDSQSFDFIIFEAPPAPAQRLAFTTETIAGVSNGYNNCIVDMNGDYLDDIVSSVSTVELAISYQQTNGNFTTFSFPLTNTVVSPSWSIAAGDIDNNGYNDLMYGSGSGVTFLKSNNDGTGYITDRKTQSFLVQRTNFTDLNNDGKLDAFACDDNAPNRYYLNDGIALNHVQGGIGDFASGGNYGSIWFDYDNDGDSDVYIAKCGQGGSGAGGNIDQLYRNNGDGTYTNMATQANMANPEQTWSGAVGDFNNDGWMDVVVGVNSASDGITNVKRNNGDGTFTSVTTGSGYEVYPGMGREYVAHDFDNDGFLDILGSSNNIMFGDGNFHFTPNATTYTLNAFKRPVGDLNNDGFLDIQNGTSVLFNNGNTNNWLKVNLRGIQSNRNGIGARIEIYGAWGKQIRDVQSGTGFQNMSTLNTHFGIGQETQISQVIIRWPSGIVDTIQNPASNQALFVPEGSTLAVADFNSSSFTLYPNPTQKILHINANNGITFISATVFDLNGRVVLESTLENGTVHVQTLAAGTYIALLLDENGKSYSSKFIKE
ncbi:FG-GAP-like repeat-containing protein [Flavobacterium sp.]